MSAIGIAVMGAGSMRCAPAIIGSLASYFGERPLEVCLYDADPERLELFRRLASVCFAMAKSTHMLMSTGDPGEALFGASRVILAVDDNCATKFGRTRNSEQLITIESVLPIMLSEIPEDAALLSLLSPDIRIPLDEYFHLDWPEPLSEEASRGLAHQVIRWVRADDYMHEFVKRYERSPLKDWIEDLYSAQLIRNR